MGAGGKAGAHPKGTCDKCDGGHMTDDCPFYKKKKDVCAHPLSSECGTCETVKARFWPWLSGKNPQNVFSCPLFARERKVVPSSLGDGKRLAPS